MEEEFETLDYYDGPLLIYFHNRNVIAIYTGDDPGWPMYCAHVTRINWMRYQTNQICLRTLFLSASYYSMIDLCEEPLVFRIIPKKNDSILPKAGFYLDGKKSG